MGIFGQAIERFAVGLLDRAFGATERARKPPHQRVGDDHRRQLAPGQHVAADRHLVVGQVVMHPLVEALVAAAEQGDARLCGQFGHQAVVEHLATDAVSIGRYVLSGGELAAMVVSDAVLRKLPGALGDADSAVEESFSEALEGAPEYPHYTRPAAYKGWEVPEILLSGDHAKVREWRLARSRERA